MEDSPKSKLILGNSLEKLRELAPNSIDAVVTDAPYGISFMSKKWDYDVPSIVMWRQVLRVLKPGGYLLCACGTRTQHRMAVNIEDAGFEIRDLIAWLYGSGFPKNHRINQDPRFCQCAASEHNVSCKDREQPTAVRKDMAVDVCDDVLPNEDVHRSSCELSNSQVDYQTGCDSDDEQLPSSEGAAQESSPSQEYALGHSHSGELCDDQSPESSHSLSPAQCNDHPSNQDSLNQQNLSNASLENIHKSSIRAELLESSLNKSGNHRKTSYANGLPLCNTCGKPKAEGLGTALKPACELFTLAMKPIDGTFAENVIKHGTGGLNVDAGRIGSSGGTTRGGGASRPGTSFDVGNFGVVPLNSGRWPANIIFDEAAAEMLDEQTGDLGKSSGGGMKDFSNSTLFQGEASKNRTTNSGFGDSGGASRFFYTAKASKRERDLGLDGLPEKLWAQSGGAQSALRRGETEYHSETQSGYDTVKSSKNHHPTVKPLKLMEYLVRLVTPPGGTVLDCYMGSGTTGVAAARLGFNFVGIERDPEYFEIARRRIEHAGSED